MRLFVEDEALAEHFELQAVVCVERAQDPAARSGREADQRSLATHFLGAGSPRLASLECAALRRTPARDAARRLTSCPQKEETVRLRSSESQTS